MKKEVSDLVKHSGIYGLGSLLSKSVGFLMIPVYTHYLVPAQYGVLEMLDLTIFFSGIFGMMGIHSAFFRFFVAAESTEEKRTVTSSALFSVVTVSTVVVVLMQFLAGALSDVAFGNATYAPLVRIVAFTLFFTNLTEVPLAHLRAQKRTVLFVVIGLGRTVLSATLLIVAVAVLQKGVPGVVYANLISSGIVGSGLVIALVVKDCGRISREKLAQMVRFGAPLVAQTLASFVLVFSDRFFLRHYANLAEVGIYGLGYKLAGIVALIVTGPFSMTWAWQQFEVAKQENAETGLAKIQTYQFFVSILVALAISVLAKDLLRIMSAPSYWSAATVVPIIALSYVLGSLRSVLYTGILVRKTTHHLAWTSGVVAVANLALNYFLIPTFHIMGAAVATVLSYALSLVLSFIVAQRVFRVHYEYARNFIIFCLAAVSYLLSALLNLKLVPSVLANCVLIGLFLLASLKLLTADERGMFLQLAQSMAHRARGVIAWGSR